MASSNRVNLIIQATTPADKSVTTTITYVNPQATNEKLIELGTAINNLTGNTVKQFVKDTREVLV